MNDLTQDSDPDDFEESDPLVRNLDSLEDVIYSFLQTPSANSLMADRDALTRFMLDGGWPLAEPLRYRPDSQEASELGEIAYLAEQALAALGEEELDNLEAALEAASPGAGERFRTIRPLRMECGRDDKPAAAIVRDVLDPWRTMTFKCPGCGAMATGGNLDPGDLLDELLEMRCPHCGELTLIVSRPHVSELVAVSGQLPPEVRAEVMTFAQEHRRWHDQKLQREDQLPDLAAEHIVLIWDEDSLASEVVIRFGEREIFRGPASWEYYSYFLAACKVLRRKYGERLHDVTPTGKASDSICGDKLRSPGWVEQMRRRIRLASNIDNWQHRDIKPQGSWENYTPSGLD